MQAALVIGRVDEDLVNAAGFCLHVHRAEIVDRKALVAVECRVLVWDDTHRPTAVGLDCFEGRGSFFFVARTKGARATQLGADDVGAAGEVARAFGPFGHDCDPSSVQRIQTHLAHRHTMLRLNLTRNMTSRTPCSQQERDVGLLGCSPQGVAVLQVEAALIPAVHTPADD